MDNNMNNGVNGGINRENPVVNPTPNQVPVGRPVNPAPTPRPVAPPRGNNAPVYNPQPPQNNQGNPYMPYGNYNQAKAHQNGKKKTKGKRKGIIIALISTCLALIFAIGVLIIFLVPEKEPEENGPNGDNTQMEIVTPPMKAEDVETASDVYKKVKDSSVGVLVYINNQQTVYSEGTGVVMGYNEDKTSAYIITCAHVINVRKPRIIVQTDNGTQYDAYVVGVDEKTDIGLLRVRTTDLQPAEFANTDELEVGATVYAIGNPGGTHFFGSFTDGIVSAIARPIDSPVGYEVACIQHSAAINPGNSGGALINQYGQVIGINSSKIASTEFEGMGFAVPTNTVKEVVDELIKNGYVSNRPVLGVKFVPATQNQTYSIVVKANNLPAGSVIIEDIMAGSDLFNTEVKEGDMIVAVDGRDLDTYDVLLETIENGKIGDKLTLKICRVDANYNISTFNVDVKLVEDTSAATEKKDKEQKEDGLAFPFDE